MAVNLREVARLAGVSVTTASRVLSGSDYPVRAEARQRVQAAAQELDYVPNAQAQALLQGTTRTVGVLVGEVDDPYFAEIVNGIQSIATTHRLLVTICHTQRDVTRELEYFRLLQAHRTGVIILAGSGLADDHYTKELAARARSVEASGGRVVAIGTPHLDVDRVLVDNRSGAAELGRHLAVLGHREVGVLAGDPKVASTSERLDGLREALAEVGGVLNVLHCAQTRDAGVIAAERLLEESPRQTALVATADQMAIGALAHLRRSSRPVPGELSVAGFNDISVAQDVHPALTTVRLPLHEMGRQALAMSLRPRSDERTALRLGTELVERASSGPVRRTAP